MTWCSPLRLSGAETDALDAPGERAVERKRIAHAVVLDARRGQDADAVFADPAQGERERLGGRPIEPLLVVDRQHDRRRRRPGRRNADSTATSPPRARSAGRPAGSRA